MKPRGFGLLGFLPYIIGGIAVASLAGWLWWQYGAWKERLREEGRVEVRAEWQAEREQLIAARDAMVMRWAKAIQEVERVYVTQVVERETRFAGIRERAAGASYSGTIRLSPGAVGVLGDAAAAANADDSRSAGEGERAAAPVPEAAGGVAENATIVLTEATDWVRFAVDAAEAYADARDKWQACVSWAGSIRNVP